MHFEARQQLMASAKKKYFVEVTVKSIYPRYSHRKAENIIRLATIRVHNKEAQNLCGGCVSYKNTSSAPILHLFLLFLHKIKRILFHLLLLCGFISQEYCQNPNSTTTQLNLT